MSDTPQSQDELRRRVWQMFQDARTESEALGDRVHLHHLFDQVCTLVTGGREAEPTDEELDARVERCLRQNRSGEHADGDSFYVDGLRRDLRAMLRDSSHLS